MELNKSINYNDFIAQVEFMAINEKAKRWKILCLTTDFVEFAELKKKLALFNYRRIQYGEVVEIILDLEKKKENKTPRAEIEDLFKGYIVKHNNLFLFFSNENVDDIRKYFINYFLKKVKNIYYLWIPKKILEDLIVEFENKYEKMFITKFFSERNLLDTTKSHFREETKRRIEYIGDDGLETLKELNYYYGVRPYIADFDIIEKCAFSINCEGFFRYEFGDLHFLIKIINKTYNKVYDILTITKSSSYKEVPIRELELTTLKIQPIVVKFNKFELNIDNFEIFSQNLNEAGFDIFNTYMKSGSIKMHSKVIDTNKKAIFNISSGGKELVITPQYKTTFDTIFRLLEVISEKIDSELEYSLYRRVSDTNVKA